MRVNYLDITDSGCSFFKPSAFKIRVSNMKETEKTYTDEEVRQALESIRNWLK